MFGAGKSSPLPNIFTSKKAPLIIVTFTSKQDNKRSDSIFSGYKSLGKCAHSQENVENVKTGCVCVCAEGHARALRSPTPYTFYLENRGAISFKRGLSASPRFLAIRGDVLEKGSGRVNKRGSIGRHKSNNKN